mmetsp:Transcript_41496/g.115347  ORF Transcript_41496/g.115347 Transcript_41496/m.115347 type:complete len:341 (-) Transcript_41496:407-1429(-)
MAVLLDHAKHQRVLDEKEAACFHILRDHQLSAMTLAATKLLMFAAEDFHRANSIAEVWQVEVWWPGPGEDRCRPSAQLARSRLHGRPELVDAPHGFSKLLGHVGVERLDLLRQLIEPRTGLPKLLAASERQGLRVARSDGVWVELNPPSRRLERHVPEVEPQPAHRQRAPHVGVVGCPGQQGSARLLHQMYVSAIIVLNHELLVRLVFHLGRISHGRILEFDDLNLHVRGVHSVCSQELPGLNLRRLLLLRSPPPRAPVHQYLVLVHRHGLQVVHHLFNHKVALLFVISVDACQDGLQVFIKAILLRADHGAALADHFCPGRVARALVALRPLRAGKCGP